MSSLTVQCVHFKFQSKRSSQKKDRFSPVVHAVLKILLQILFLGNYRLGARFVLTGTTCLPYHWSQVNKMTTRVTREEA